MKNKRNAFCITLIIVMYLLSSCSKDSSSTAQTIIEMELTESYDISDPFINEALFYVSENPDTMELDISFQMEGKSGILEIADNETKQVLWSDTWTESVDNTAFKIKLNNLDNEKEYIIRFTGTETKYAKIVVTSDNDLFKEREKPKNKTDND